MEFLFALVAGFAIGYFVGPKVIEFIKGLFNQPPVE